MGMWIELGVFVLALAFGLWQIHDVKKAMRERERREAREKDEVSSPHPQPLSQRERGEACATRMTGVRA